MKEEIYCPLCGEKLEYVEFNSSTNHKIHIYTHDNTCPFIGFEFVSEQDLIGFNEYLKKRG